MGLLCRVTSVYVRNIKWMNIEVTKENSEGMVIDVGINQERLTHHRRGG